MQQQICFSVDHKTQTLSYLLPQKTFIMVHCRTLLPVDICHMAWQFNGFLILDKNKAQSFCKEFEFLDGSFPNNSCASKLSQFAICGHNTQTFTSVQNRKSLGLFPAFRVYEVFSNIMSVQLSTSSNHCSEPQDPAGSSDVLLSSRPWRANHKPSGEKKVRERNKRHHKAHRLHSYTFLSTPTTFM